MSANYRAVNHPLFHIRVVGKVLQHPFPDALVTPTGKTLVDTVLSAIFSRQEPPLRTAPGQPEDAFHKPATFTFVLAEVGIRFAPQEISYLCPLAILELHSCHEASLSFLLKC
jgi:hypothetical protein